MNKQTKGKMKVGKIVSRSGEKTVIVAVNHFVSHPLYEKAVRRTRRFAVHNDIADLAVGDQVKIAEVRPISKTKRFIVVSKL